jgi:galactonate dehydratase
MKITDIQCHLMQAGSPPHTGWTATGKSALSTSRNWLFVTVHTDAGLFGTGEGSGWPRAVATAIDDLRHVLIGKDPADIELIAQTMRVAMMGHGQTGVVGGGALAAIDIALWDLKGKALRTSVANLLGGITRSRVPYYTHAPNAEKALQAVANGVRGVKVGGIANVVERAFAVRAAVGPDVDVMVDLHGPPWLCAADAIAIGRALEPLDLLFLEEPVAPDDHAGWKRVRDQVALPLAGGERFGTMAEMLRLIDDGLVDVIQPDTGRFGGLTQMRKLAAIAEAHGVSVAPHSGSLGPLAEFAAVQLLASIPNALALERLEPDWPGRQQTLKRNLETRDGAIEVPREPGLGTEIDADFVSQHPSRCNTAIATGGWNEGTEDEMSYSQPRRPRSAIRRKEQ